MLKIIFILISFLLTISPVYANYTLIVPSPKGTGTAIWGDIVANELSKYLKEKIVIVNIKGGKGNLGLETFKVKYKNDPKAILLAHGGNATQWLINDVKWSFKDWNPIVVQPYNITTTIKKGFDWKNERLNLADCSGCVPETLAWAMLKGWDNINFIRKMSAGEAKTAWLRGDFKYIREPASRHIKNTLKLVKNGNALRLFNHGIYTTEGFIQDYNWPDTPTAIDLYKKTYGAYPSGDIYEAYLLSAVWRDGLQKALFMHKNSHSDDVIKAFTEMAHNKESKNYLVSKLGDYPMFIGVESNKVMASLYSYVTPKRLKTLVAFARDKMRWSTATYVHNKTN